MESKCVCRFYQDLSYEERSKMLKDRLKKYSQKVSKHCHTYTARDAFAATCGTNYCSLQSHPLLL